MELELFEPYDKQIEVIESLMDNSIFNVMALCGRRVGKTAIGENMALYWCLNDPGCKVYWVSPSESQASKVYNEIISALGDSKSYFVESNKGGKSDIEIVFKNKSKIQFRSAKSGDSLRGEGINYMILDEAAFIKEQTWEMILQPMLLVGGKKLLIITTPKGKNWIFKTYNSWLREKNSKVFRFSSYSSPFGNIELLDNIKSTTNEKIFQQEYLAEFIDSSSVFDNIFELCVLDELEAPELGKMYWAGIDIGLVNDASVLSVIDENYNVVKIYHWKNIDSPQLTQEIKNINSIWNFQSIAIENNNQGRVIYDYLKLSLNNIIEFNTNTKSKGEIINRMIYLFKSKSIQLINNVNLISELESFIFEQTQSGHIQFKAEGNKHDDIVMSVAISVWCKDNQVAPYKPGFFRYKR